MYKTDKMAKEASNAWEELIEINFKEGGAFIAEPGLGANNVPGVLDLFAALTCAKILQLKTRFCLCSSNLLTLHVSILATDC